MSEKKTAVVHIKCEPTLKERVRVKSQSDHRSISDATRLLYRLYANGEVDINE